MKQKTDENEECVLTKPMVCRIVKCLHYIQFYDKQGKPANRKVLAQIENQLNNNLLIKK